MIFSLICPADTYPIKMKHAYLFPRYVVIRGMLLGAMFSSPLCAEEVDLYALSLEQLSTINVTIASRSEQTAKLTASSVTVYTQNDIRSMGIETLEELLNFVPGVQTSRTQQEFAAYPPIFRGNAGLNGSAPNVLLMLDGRRLNSHVHGGGFEAPLNNLDWIKQVEVIRGPGSSLYGVNAFMGVINLVSEINNSVNLEIGSLGAQSASLQYSDSFRDAEVAIFAHHYSDDGEYYSPFYQFLGTFEGTRDPLKRNTLAANVSYSGWSLENYFSRSVADDFVLGSTLGNGINSQDSELSSHRLSYSGLKGENWDINLYAEYVRNTTDYFIRLMPAQFASQAWWADGSLLDAVGGNHLSSDALQIGLQAKVDLHNDHVLSFGGQFRDENVDVNPVHGNWVQEVMEQSRGTTILPCDCISRGFYLGGERYDFLSAGDRRVLNAWLQDQWVLSNSVELTLGARYDHYDDFGGNLSLRSSAVFQYDDNTQFKLIYGEAFRAPSFNDTRAAPASNFAANADLNPETIKTVDLVFQKTFSSSNLIVTFSNSKTKDEINLVPLDIVIQPGITVLQPQNTGSRTLNNWEVEFNHQVQKNTLLRVGVTHHINHSELGVARDLVFFSLNYGYESIKLNINGYYRDEVLSRRGNGSLNSQDIWLDSYWDLKFTGLYKMTDNLTFSLKVSNLLDEAYKSYTTTDGGLEFGLPNRSRRVSLGLEWRY